MMTAPDGLTWSDLDPAELATDLLDRIYRLRNERRELSRTHRDHPSDYAREVLFTVLAFEWHLGQALEAARAERRTGWSTDRPASSLDLTNAELVALFRAPRP